MKNTIYAFILSIAMFSCKKQDSLYTAQDSYLQKVKASLQDSLSAESYQTLDFSRASASGIDSLHIKLLRIPLVSKPIATDFLVVETDEGGFILSGRFISIAKDTTKRLFTGTISYHSLRGRR